MSSPVIPLALAGAALYLMSGSKSKGSKGSSIGDSPDGLTYKLPPGGKIPQLYGPGAAQPSSNGGGGTGVGEDVWKNRQQALYDLSKVRFSFQGSEISLCAKCDPQGVDGKPGNDTRNAVKAFQALAGIPVTGDWDQATNIGMTNVIRSLVAGVPIPCDPLLSYAAPLGCFALQGGTFGLMPSVANSESEKKPPSTSKPAPSTQEDPPPSTGGPKYGSDELLVANGDCSLILHQDDAFFDEQKMLIIESALDGLTDGQAANEIHEEMMRRYIPMCLFLGKDQVGQGVKTWWSTNLAHVASSLKSYELLPEMLEEDAYKYGIL